MHLTVRLSAAIVRGVGDVELAAGTATPASCSRRCHGNMRRATA